MNLLNESLLYHAIKFFGAIFCRLPSRVNLAIARCVGLLGYYLMKKKRGIVMENLKTVFPSSLSDKDIQRLAKENFQNFACSFMDLFCLPKMIKEGYEKTVTIEGIDNMIKALSSGKGCILLAVHSGSWELASLVGSLCDYPYNVVANEQGKAPLLNELLNDYRRLAGAKVIPPGFATRDIIRALQSNEVVSLVLDQGGRSGIPVEFFGKTASMSTGAIRLGLKYRTPVCPVWIERQKDGRHLLKVFAPLNMEITHDIERDVVVNTQRAVTFFEGLLRLNPSEYMWFYKVYKYSTESDVLVLDDGKTGHLRQSQSVCESLDTILSQSGKRLRVKVVLVEFKYRWYRKLFAVYCWVAQLLQFLRKPIVLKFFLTETSYKALVGCKPDYIISCGSLLPGVNFILSRWSIKSIHILKSGILSRRWFSLTILPEHDRPRRIEPKGTVLTKVALNLITPQYLKQQQEGLLARYSYLKDNVRFKIGVLIGGNTKGVVFDVQQIRSLIHQLKEASKHFNMDILLTTSRRTPLPVDEVIIKGLRDFERCSLLVIANESNIPEAVGGILALSDLLIVSGESISMISEAVSSGKKTIVFAPQGNYSPTPSNKYDRFVFNLSEQGYVLAASIKDISTIITQALSQKISVKMVEDRTRLLEAIKEIV